MLSPLLLAISILYIASTHGLPSGHYGTSKKLKQVRRATCASSAPSAPNAPSAPPFSNSTCPPNFRNAVFNTGAPKSSGWPDKTWGSLSSNGVSNWIGFTELSIHETQTYNVNGQPAATSPSLDNAQIKICMDPSKIEEARVMITGPNPPTYLELFNEPDFSYMGFTPLTSPQDAAKALQPILAAKTTTQFISPAPAFTNSDWLSQFNDACGQCIDGPNSKIGIIGVHIYNADPNAVIGLLQTLHGRWPSKRIWVTELAPASDPAQGCKLDKAGVIKWMQTVVPRLVGLGYVDKIFWNSGEHGALDPNNPDLCNPSLTNEDGSPTDLLTAFGKVC